MTNRLDTGRGERLAQQEGCSRWTGSIVQDSRPTDHYDLVVIGSGPAGEKAAAKAAYFGRRVAVVERRQTLGGAGTNTGTLPSKALKESALFYSGRYDKGLYGADRSLRGRTTIDDFMFRKAAVVEASAEEIRENLRRHGVTVYKGDGRLTGSNSVLIESPDNQVVEISADKTVIATGSYPCHPPSIPFDGKRIHDSDSILQISRLPRSLCIVGTGVVGCEYATIFAAMGTKVCVVNHTQQILGFLDQEIARALVDQMRSDGIEIEFGASLETVRAPASDDEDIVVGLDTGTELSVDMFLFAAGRSGCTGSLNCEQAGVDLGNRETILVNQHYQTSVPHIYAVGDVIGFPALASTSMDQGRVAVSHMFQINDYDGLPKVLPYGIYTIPEVSMVGMTEEQAKMSGVDYLVGRAHHSRIARGMIMGATSGVMKLVIRRHDSVIIGVHVIGQLASELIHYGLTLVGDRRSIMHVTSTVFNYPTFHELYKYACYDALSNLSGRNLRRS